MAFKAPPKILQKVLGFKAFQHRDGKLFLWGVPGTLSPLYVSVYLVRLMEKELGEKKTMSLFYHSGRFQGKQAFEIISKNFGYAETLHDKKELLLFNTGQGDVIGLGSFEWTMVDFNKKYFVAKVKSNIAEEYKRFFGNRKSGVDYFVRGIVSTFVEELIKEPTLTIETKCVGSGKPFCEFVTKPVKHWDKNDPLVKEQTPENLSSFKELGAKIEPYLNLG
ncbi:hypothetical protein HYW21_07655 [Candidatus Woesearchaeota archaeon]|nr:hypothetical protein [Candidatus Woesearchaeota archaeon]